MYNSLDVAKVSFVDLLIARGPQVLPLLQTPMKSFICPSDANRFAPLTHTARHFGGGVGTSAAGMGNWRPSVSNYMSSRGMRNNNQVNVNNDTHGMFMGVLSVAIRDVTDGTSNTFLIGERDTLFCRSGTWVGVRNPRGNRVRGFYYNTANCRVLLNAPDPPFAWNSRQGCSEGFSSMHPDGALFALADGSVRFISDTIEVRPCSLNGFSCWNAFQPGNPNYEPLYGVYQRLARRNDGFAVDIPGS
jgi:hypothetical protein